MNDIASSYQKQLNEALTAIQKLRRRVEELEGASSEPIAVIGMGCRFPPDIDSPEAFWALLERGGDGVTEIPADRWDCDFYHDLDVNAPGKICTREGGFLRHKDLFDPQFFKISPREASYMDPQQRLLLEVAWEALENANIPIETLHGSDGGVFVGISGFDYANLVAEYLPEDEVDPTVGTGGGHSPASGRLSYILGLQGPSISLDTACSSSLVAVHAGCESLKKRECSIALAGGVNMILSPFNHIVFSRAHMLSPDGRCKAFDESADGYGRSEGAGLLVLKRLSDALANHDTILAVIRGGAVNQDGPSGGLTVPNGPAQQTVIRKALANAGLKPADVDYVEAHGTGTPLGDPIEINALGEVFKESHASSRPLWIGSAKTNLGHMESAAGIGGLIKVILQLQKGMIAPHLHFHRPSTRIPWAQLPVQIPATLVPWSSPAGKKRVAGVSSFGFSGTNAHLILESAPASEPGTRQFERAAHLFTLSAKTEPALGQLASRYSSALEQRPDWDLSDICYSASTGRSHLKHRAALVAVSNSDLKKKLELLHRGEAAESVFQSFPADNGGNKVAFLFTGQASQYYGMGRELYETQPLFRELLEKCDGILSQEAGWSLIRELYSSLDPSRVHQTGYTQPLLFSIEYALARLWQSWGVQPAALMGHSVGEYVAATIAGVFSLEDGLKLIATRGKLMQALPQGGGMVAIQSTLEKARTIIASCSSQVSIAAINGPNSIVISGPQEEMRKTAAACRSENVMAAELAVSHAFHSPLMASILPDFAAAARKVAYSKPHIDIVSNVTGDRGGEALADPEYWVRHISMPVRFRDGVETLSRLGCKIMLEIGPKPTLIDMGRKCVEADLHWLASLRPGRSDWEQMLQSLAKMFVQGLAIDWESVNRGYFLEKPALPTYPFQRERYWFVPDVVQKKTAKGMAGPAHPLLGRRIPARESAEGQIIFESTLGKNLAYLADHRVLGKAIFPAAGYIEVAIAAGYSVFGKLPVLKNFAVEGALVLPQGDSTRLRTIVEPQTKGDYVLKILSKQAGEGDASEEWILHAQCLLSAVAEEFPPCRSLDSLRQEIVTTQEIDAYYEKAFRHGLEYGPAFHTIRELQSKNGQAIGLIALPENLSSQPQEYILHPALLDGAFQLLGSTLEESSAGGTYLPIGFESLHSLKPFSGDHWAHVALRPSLQEKTQVIVADITVYGGDGRSVAVVSGLRLVHTTAAALKRVLERDPAEFLYHFDWMRLAPLEGPAHAAEQECFLIFADAGGLGHQASLQLRKRGSRTILVYAQETDKVTQDKEGNYTVNPECVDDLLSVLNEAEPGSFRATLYFWGLDTPVADEHREISFVESKLLGCGPLLNVTKALATHRAVLSVPLCVFTRNTFSIRPGDPVHVEQAALTGLVRVIRLEYPSLHCTQIDLDVNGVAEVESRQVVCEILSGDGGEQVALRSGLRFGMRLARTRSAHNSAAGGPVQVVVGEYGAFENLSLKPLQRRQPGRGEVEVAVRAAGINFKDVLHVLGMLKEHAAEKGLAWVDRRTLGFECSGIIAGVGEGVGNVKVGDAVICFGSDCLGSYVTLKNDAVILKPVGVTFEEAAAVSTAFLTAYHALYTLANIKPGEKVLIHAAAGSVGQAAIQLCRRLGAEVFATASPAKWDFLRSQGVLHVMNSRNTDFKDQVHELTNGRGVDVLVNSLGGDFIPSNLKVLANGGRFIEIGKLDIWTSEQIAAVRPDVSYFTFDLSEVAQDVTAGFGPVLRQVTTWMSQGTVKPVPVEIFPADQVIHAFRHLAQGKNIGKVIVGFPLVETGLEEKPLVRPDGCYWITGGLGALGLKIAEWLIEQGAHHLVLIGRHIPSPEAAVTLAGLKERGARLDVVTADVGCGADVAEVLERIDRSLSPLRGIIHAAGVLDDGILQDQNWDRFERVMAPKIGGVWNLHRLTQGWPLDFFVCFSSLAAVLGSPGQGNYAAANAYMDVLMQQRRSIGLPGMSIDWGPWAAIGMAAQLDKGLQTQMAAKGVKAISLRRALSTLDYVLRLNPSQVVIAAMDWQKFAQQFRPGLLPKMLAALVRVDDCSASEGPEIAHYLEGMRDDLYSAPVAERRAVLLEQVRRILATTLRLPSAESVGVNQALGELGLDSLMAVEVRNLLTNALGCQLSSTLLFDYPTANALTAHLLEVLFPEQTTVGAIVAQPASDIDRMLAVLETMPDIDAEHQLGQIEHAVADTANRERAL